MNEILKKTAFNGYSRDSVEAYLKELDRTFSEKEQALKDHLRHTEYERLEQEKELATCQDSLSRKNEEYTALNDLHTRLRAELETEHAELLACKDDLALQNSALAECRDELCLQEEAYRSLQEQEAQLRAELEREKEKNRQMVQQAEAGQQQIAALQKKVADLPALREELTALCEEVCESARRSSESVQNLVSGFRDRYLN